MSANSLIFDMNGTKNIAICCITYKRSRSLMRLLESLNNAVYDESTTLFISVDKSDSDEVELLADSFRWLHGPKRVIRHETNLGLRKHILSCGDLLNEFDGLIVLEDDITVSPGFFMYAKQCVEKYSDVEDCAGISLYNFPICYHNSLPFTPIRTESDVYMMECAQSWGQVWMKKQWFEFKEWYESNNEEFGELPHLPKSICLWPKTSWLKYHTRYCIEKSKFFIYPYVSLSTNNGDSGTHNKTNSTLFQAPLLEGVKTYDLNPTVRYDGFFENMHLAESLGVDQDDLCVDLYGTKQNRERKRYWLTTSQENFGIKKSFALDLKPWDANILHGREGSQIFLYDTDIECKNKFDRPVNKNRYLFSLRDNSIRMLLKELLSSRFLGR